MRYIAAFFLAILIAIHAEELCPEDEKFFPGILRNKLSKACLMLSKRTRKNIAFLNRECMNIPNVGTLAKLDVSDQDAINLLLTNNIAYGYFGCTKVQNGTWTNVDGTSCESLDPQPFESLKLHNNVTLIILVDQTDPTKVAEKVEFLKKYYAHTNMIGVTYYTASLYRCKNPMFNWDVFNSNDQRLDEIAHTENNCALDNSYSLADLFFALVPNVYAPYPDYKLPTTATPVIIFSDATSNDISGITPIFAINSQSPVIFITPQSNTNFQALVQPSSLAKKITYTDLTNQTEINNMFAQLDKYLYPTSNMPNEAFRNFDSTGNLIAYINASVSEFIFSQSELIDANFFCEVDADGLQTSATSPKAYHCPSDYTILVDNYCLKIFEQNLSYVDAINECKNDQKVEGSQLAYLGTSTMMKGLEEAIQNNKQLNGISRFWFGLNSINSTDKSYFGWVSGGDLDENYAPWIEGYPRLADGEECVAYSQNDNKWLNIHCNTTLYAICSKLAV